MLSEAFLAEHRRLTRRFFLRAGVAGSALLVTSLGRGTAAEKPVRHEKQGAWADPYFTSAESFRDVSRGKPLPHTLSEEKKREVGLTRETWKLEVISDPEHPARLGKPMTAADNTALDFAGLLEIGQQHAVRFAKVMTCLNLGCPLGMGVWEGVPLREVVWRTQPRENLRRVFYYGYHNDDPAQMFRSSLPIGRVLEDPFDLPPVILCYKLNGEWLNSERGGPVRVVVPEAYGFKSIKWLTHVVLTNLAAANDTYAEQNNDVDSPLKTFAATLNVPAEVAAGQAIAVSGYAQVGISGLSKVQVCLTLDADAAPAGDPYFTKGAWKDAEILGPPPHWGSVPEGKVPAGTLGFDASGVPKGWPMRLTNAHWAAVLEGVPVGDYTLRCRSVDEKGIAQPLPRPFKKSGHAAIESVPIKVR
ncbi:Oxidoreductase molybdopterin binding domain-containing protein [Planctomicrobium piriforme]|uniref:Oxidoreductase molybdopterin binding domain-containing protein n=2 Tax=Planctomicrobium piriforme TaxID=1576369 RepID=A0A1I3LRN8_9PLAN|nr:Oxidoreductase molybdopterin binding domain-containing protein [Planctomicrobium piriforme]